jgi:hypothetical protein
MKNKKILPNTLVPEKLRFKLYKQAYDDIINGTPIETGLCLSLPMYLWELKDVYDFAPNGQNWYAVDTPNMFPELNDELKGLNIINRFMNPNERIAFLERILIKSK